MALYKRPKAKTKDFYVVDVETRGLSARPESFIFGCVYGKDGFRKVFYDVKLLGQWLISKRNKGKYIFAHNAEFDFTTIFDNIILNLDRSAVFVGSTFICAKCNGVYFYNSLSILKSSVSALGKVLGIEKMGLDDKFKRGDKKISVTKEDIEYCFRDCEIVYDYLELIFNMTGKIKPTIASCAMEIFTTQFLQKKIKIHPLNENFRASYYGGRVECFSIGKVQGRKYDVNSLYPFVCSYMSFPNFEKLKKEINVDKRRFLYLLQNFEGQAEIEVIHKESFIGVLPYRRNEEIVYPSGRYTGKWNFNEIRQALPYCTIIKIKSVIFGERIKFKALANYMLEYYVKKNETDGAEKLIYKFLLNALTGKFAEKEHSNFMYFKDFYEFLQEETFFAGRQFEFHHFSKSREDFFVSFKNKQQKTRSWLIPTISSYITSEARAYMLPFYIKHKRDIIYTDTDSIVMTGKLDSKYVGSGLGMFKEEKEIVTKIIGNKHYLTKIDGKDYLYLKGIPKDHIKKNDFYSFKKMTRTREALRRGTDAGIFIEIVKSLKHNYTKRKVLAKGKTKMIKL
jgi:hypothetical protein